MEHGLGHMGTFREIVLDHIENARRILYMAKADLVKQYRGAVFGWVWAVVRPAVTIFVFWFAFSFGIRRGAPIEGYPFFLWLISGFVPWFFMRDSITNSAQSIRKYKYLVQKLRFPMDTIPTFVCLSNLATNVCLFLLVIIIFMVFGYPPSIYYLQLPVCYLMAFVFFAAFGLLSSVISAVSKDFLNFVRAMVTAIFWLSGIIYDVETVEHEWIRNILMFNPVTIIARAFRDSMVYDRWLFEEPVEMRNYLIVTAITIVLACYAYSKLKRKIPDVL